MTYQFTAAKIAPNLASCEERIASIQARMETWSAYKGVMGLMESHAADESKTFWRDAPQLDNVKADENALKLVKTEKMLYTALVNPKTNKSIYKVILTKYDALLGLSYDLSGNMVLNGIKLEGEYLDYCKESMEQREYIRKLCCVGNGGFIHM